MMSKEKANLVRIVLDALEKENGTYLTTWK